MNLPRVQLGFPHLLIIFVEHLEFAHAAVSGVSFARVTNGKTVVASGRNLEFKTHHKVGIDLLGEYGSPLTFLALDGAFDDLIVVQRSGPPGEIFAIEDALEPFLIRFSHDGKSANQ